MIMTAIEISFGESKMIFFLLPQNVLASYRLYNSIPYHKASPQKFINSKLRLHIMP